MELFATRGYASTSLQDVADALGMTRPALYYYVKNKDEILAKLVAEVTEVHARAAVEINAQKSRPPLERLAAMVHAIVLHTAQHAPRFRLVVMSEAELPPDVARVHKRRKHQVLHEFVSVIEDASEQGHARPVDSRVAALGVLGLCNWVAWWHHPGDGRTDAAIADQLAEMAVQTIAVPPDRKTGGLGGAVRLLKQDLAVLERAIEGLAR